MFWTKEQNLVQKYNSHISEKLRFSCWILTHPVCVYQQEPSWWRNSQQAVDRLLSWHLRRARTMKPKHGSFSRHSTLLSPQLPLPPARQQLSALLWHQRPHRRQCRQPTRQEWWLQWRRRQMWQWQCRRHGRVQVQPMLLQPEQVDDNNNNNNNNNNNKLTVSNVQ